MMFHRSDWPEVGLSGSVQASDAHELAPCAEDELCYAWHDDESGIALQLRAGCGQFESNLYRFPMWDVRLEALGPQGLDGSLRLPPMQQYLSQLISTLLSEAPAEGAYIFAKVVAEEPLHAALTDAAFEAVEHRRIYKCKVGDLLSGQESNVVSGIRFVTLEQVPADMRADVQEQVIGICRESFNTGNTRHFKDSFLRGRLPGTEYIVAVMKLNFSHLAAKSFLIAIDDHTDEVCGFSVVGSKHGLGTDTYTQLLSAVNPAYRGRGIYRGLTNLLATKFPTEATLLNVTHVETESIQRAYAGSGRIHLADTLLLRRVLEPHA